MRFTVNERIQHLVLFTSFFILAYTGFALRYKESWWALPFTVLELGFDWRGVVHRIAAFLFSVLTIYHILFVMVTKRGRDQICAMWPKKKDVSDFIQMISYNLSKSKQKPRFEHYGYIEKAEYWALVWGSVIMILTGAMLTFDEFTMRYIPKWILDVAGTIHFYEALLATLAIFVWHFYFVIFDPDHYPLNLSMVTGKASEEKRKAEG